MAKDANLANLAINLLIKVGGGEALAGIKDALNSVGGVASEAGKKLDGLGNSSGKVSSFFAKAGSNLTDFGNKVSSVGTKLTLGLTTPIAGLAAGFTKAAIDFESVFAGVRKTVDATEEQFAQMEKEITALSQRLPFTASEIAGVAEAAGQLGIKTEDVMSFTETMMKLGQATNMTAEEAATQLARFANITGMTAEEYDKLGSAVVDLGNNMATTEGEIVSMGMRLASAGTMVGFSEAEIMAFAAALSSLGIEAEAGGTAFSKAMLEIDGSVRDGGKSLDEFAKVAGMSAKEFSALWGTDAAEAMNVFLAGLGRIKESGGNLAGTIEGLFGEEVRLRDTMMRAASASDLVSESVDRANSAWNANIALTEEASKRNATLESRISMMKNTIVNAGRSLGTELMPYVEKAVTAIQQWVEKFQGLDAGAKQTILVVGAIVAAIGPLVKGLGLAVKAVGGLSTAFGFLAAHPVLLTFTVLAGSIAGLVYVFDKLRKAQDETAHAAENLSETLFSIDKDKIEEGLRGIDIGREGFRAEFKIKAQVEAEIEELKLKQTDLLADGKVSQKDAKALKNATDAYVDAALEEAEASLTTKTAKYVEFLRTMTVANMTGFTKDYQIVKDLGGMVEDIGKRIKQLKPSLTDDEARKIVTALVKEPVDKWPEILRGFGFKDTALVDELVPKIEPMVANVNAFLSDIGIADPETQSKMVDSVMSGLSGFSEMLSGMGIETEEEQSAITQIFLDAFSTLRGALVEAVGAEGFGIAPEDIAGLFTAWIGGADTWAKATEGLGIPKENADALAAVFAEFGTPLADAMAKAAEAEGFGITEADIQALIGAWLTGGTEGAAWTTAIEALGVPPEAERAMKDSLKKYGKPLEDGIAELKSAEGIGLTEQQMTDIIAAYLSGDWSTVTTEMKLPPEMVSKIETAFAEVGDVLSGATPMTPEQKAAAVLKLKEALTGIIEDATTTSLYGEGEEAGFVAKYQEQVRAVMGELDAVRTQHNELVAKMTTPGYTATSEEIARMEELLTKLGLLKTELALMDSEVSSRTKAAILRVEHGTGSMEDFGTAVGHAQKQFDQKKAEIETEMAELEAKTTDAVIGAQAALAEARTELATAELYGDSAQIAAKQRAVEEAQAVLDFAHEQLDAIEGETAAKIKAAGEEKWTQIQQFFESMLSQFPELQEALSNSMEKMDIAQMFAQGDWSGLQAYADEYALEFAEAMKGIRGEDIEAAFGSAATTIDPSKILKFASSGAVDIVQEMLKELVPGEIDQQAIVDALGERYMYVDPNALLHFVMSGEVDILAEDIKDLGFDANPEAIEEMLKEKAQELNIDPNTLYTFVMSGGVDILRDQIKDISLENVDEEAVKEALGKTAATLGIDPMELFDLIASGQLTVNEEQIKALGIDEAFAQRLGEVLVAQLNTAMADADFSEEGKEMLTSLLGTMFSGDVDMEGFDTSALAGAVGGALQLSSFLDSIKTDSKSAGEAIIQGITDTMSADTTGGDAMQTWGDSLVTAFKTKMGIASPSTVMETQGGFLIAGLERGLILGKPTILAQLQSLGRNMVDSLKGVASEMTAMAESMMQGIVAGIQAGRSAVIAAMVDAVMSAVEAAKQALEIASPSKVTTKMGEQTGEGFAQGLERSTPKVRQAGQGMAEAALDGMDSGDFPGIPRASRFGRGAEGGVTIEKLIVNIQQPVSSNYELARSLRRGVEDVLLTVR